MIGLGIAMLVIGILARWGIAGKSAIDLDALTEARFIGFGQGMSFVLCILGLGFICSGLLP